MSQFFDQELSRIGISNSDLASVKKEVKVISFSAGDVVWSNGGRVDKFCMIINGFLTANAPSKSGGLAVEAYGPKMWFGEVPIINKKPSHFEFKCISDLELLSIPDTCVDALFRQSISFSNFIGELMAWRLRRQSDALVAMRLGSPHLRVISGIALFAESLAYKGERPPTVGFGEGYLIPLKQSLLASLCGVSRTIFSECILKLEHHGLLDIQYGKIELRDLESWRGFMRSREGHVWASLHVPIDDLIAQIRS